MKALIDLIWNAPLWTALAVLGGFVGLLALRVAVVFLITLWRGRRHNREFAKRRDEHYRKSRRL